MDDLLNVDLNLIDDEDLLSFPFENFESMAPPEVENILNELERGYSKSSIDFADVKPTDLFASWLNESISSPIQTPTRTKTRPTGAAAAGVSLLAKPPRKSKKRSAVTGLSLLSSPSKKDDSNRSISNAHLLLPTTQPQPEKRLKVTNVEATSQFDHDYCLPVQQRPLLLPIDTNGRLDEFSTSPSDHVIHDVDAYFNSFFTFDSSSPENNGENSNSSEDSAISTQSASDDESISLQTTDVEVITLERVEEFEQKNLNNSNRIKNQSKAICFDLDDLVQSNSVTQANESELMMNVDADCSIEEDYVEEEEEMGEEEIDDEEDDDDDEDEDDDEDLLVDETKMFINHMFSESSNRSIIHKSSQSTSTILVNSTVANSASSSSNNTCTVTVSSKEAGCVRNRTRTISASYSVRSNSACSSCSDDSSDDEPEVLLDSRPQSKLPTCDTLHVTKSSSTSAGKSSLINSKTPIVVSSGIRVVPRRELSTIWLGRYNSFDQLKVRKLGSTELEPLTNRVKHLQSKSSTLRRPHVRPRPRTLDLNLLVS